MDNSQSGSEPLNSDQKCIVVDGLDRPDGRGFTVAEYDEVLRRRFNQPIWARRSPAVEHLTTEPGDPYGPRIVDEEEYRRQMRRLVGLDS